MKLRDYLIQLMQSKINRIHKAEFNGFEFKFLIVERSNPNYYAFPQRLYKDKYPKPLLIVWRLKGEIEERLGTGGKLFVASPRLSMDNGAMVAKAAHFRLERGEAANPEVSADSKLPFPNLIPRPNRELGSTR